jgi:hypothetical protein
MRILNIGEGRGEEGRGEREGEEEKMSIFIVPRAVLTFCSD